MLCLCVGFAASEDSLLCFVFASLQTSDLKMGGIWDFYLEFRHMESSAPWWAPLSTTVLAYLSPGAGWTALRRWGTWRNSWWWRPAGVPTEAALWEDEMQRKQCGCFQRSASLHIASCHMLQISPTWNNSGSPLCLMSLRTTSAHMYIYILICSLHIHYIYTFALSQTV